MGERSGGTESETVKPVGPVDASLVPRFAGIATFARLPGWRTFRARTSPWWVLRSTAA